MPTARYQFAIGQSGNFLYAVGGSGYLTTNEAYNAEVPPTVPGAITAPAVGATVNATATITWGAATDPNGDALTYYVEYSGDNGATWTVISSGVNALTETYDFTNTAATNTALLRVRAYDGALYGPYTTMTGTFAVVHNQPPQAPTLTAPANNATIDRTIVQRFAMTFNDPNAGDSSSALAIQYRQGTGAWTVLVAGS